jgi:hypothetical protein
LHRLDEANKELAAVHAIASAQGPAAQSMTIAADELLAKIRLQEKDYDRAPANASNDRQIIHASILSHPSDGVPRI